MTAGRKGVCAVTDPITIEPGDLIRHKSGVVEVSQTWQGGSEPVWTIIAKGPGWVRHDGSSVNPVPGARCQVLSGPNLSSKMRTSTMTKAEFSDLIELIRAFAAREGISLEPIQEAA